MSEAADDSRSPEEIAAELENCPACGQDLSVLGPKDVLWHTVVNCDEFAVEMPEGVDLTHEDVSTGLSWELENSERESDE